MHVWQGRNEAYYNGFREHHLLGVFINLFCCLAYYAKILESVQSRFEVSITQLPETIDVSSYMTA